MLNLLRETNNALRAKITPDVLANMNRTDARFFERIPFRRTSDPDEPVKPFDALPVRIIENEDDTTLRKVITTDKKYRQLVSTEAIDIPYFLEMELLKHSDIGYTDQDLECVEQLMMWQVRQWAYINCGEQMTNIFETMIDKNLIHTFDLDEQPRAAEEQVRKIYKENFQSVNPLTNPVSEKLEDQHRLPFVAAPLTVKNALELMDSSRVWDHPCPPGYDVEHMDKQMLYVPIIATLSLLERERKQYKKITPEIYKEYLLNIPSTEIETSVPLNGMNNLRDSSISEIHRLAEARPENTEGLNNFSYGFAFSRAVGTPRETMEDHVSSNMRLLAKTIGASMYHMKTCIKQTSNTVEVCDAIEKELTTSKEGTSFVDAIATLSEETALQM